MKTSKPRAVRFKGNYLYFNSTVSKNIKLRQESTYGKFLVDMETNVVFISYCKKEDNNSIRMTAMKDGDALFSSFGFEQIKNIKNREYTVFKNGEFNMVLSDDTFAFAERNYDFVLIPFGSQGKISVSKYNLSEVPGRTYQVNKKPKPAPRQKKAKVKKTKKEEAVKEKSKDLNDVKFVDSKWAKTLNEFKKDGGYINLFPIGDTVFVDSPSFLGVINCEQLPEMLRFDITQHQTEDGNEYVKLHVRKEGLFCVVNGYVHEIVRRSSNGCIYKTKPYVLPDSLYGRYEQIHTFVDRIDNETYTIVYYLDKNYKGVSFYGMSETEEKPQEEKKGFFARIFGK